MTNYDVVKKLVGEIKPVGSTDIDERRFENMKAMCHLVELLVLDIDDVAHGYRLRHEHSMKEMGEYAHKFLTNNLGIVE